MTATCSAYPLANPRSRYTVGVAPASASRPAGVLSHRGVHDRVPRATFRTWAAQHASCIDGKVEPRRQHLLVAVRIGLVLGEAVEQRDTGLPRTLGDRSAARL